VVVQNPEVKTDSKTELFCSICTTRMHVQYILSGLAYWRCNDPKCFHIFVARHRPQDGPALHHVLGAKTSKPPKHCEAMEAPNAEVGVPPKSTQVVACGVCGRLYPLGGECKDSGDDRHEWNRLVDSEHPEMQDPVDAFEDDGGSVAAMEAAPDDYGLSLLVDTEAWSHLMDIRRERQN
jgi:hypothetical protein